MRYIISLKPEGVEERFASYRSEIADRVEALPRGPPHVSIYTLQAKLEDEHAMCKALESVVLRHGPISLFSRTLGLFTDYATGRQNVLVARVARDDDLESLHWETAGRLLQFIDWNETRWPAAMTIGQKESFALFGAPYFGHLYTPHMTIAHVKEAPLDTFPPFIFSGTVRSIALSRKGEAWETVCEHDLGKQF